MTHLPLNLHDLLHHRTIEGERVEHKAGWNPNPILRTLCAFANDFANLGGGYVIIGQDTDEQGRPCFPPAGLDPAELDRIQQELLTYCNLIQPPYFPVASHEVVQGRHLLILWAPGGPTRPYKVPREVTASKSREYRYYIRRYTSTIEAKGADERELISLTATVPFDDRPHPHATLADLSPVLIHRFLTAIGSDLAEQATQLDHEALCRRMNLVAGGSEAPRPKNVGLLFFHEDPRRWFPYTQIDVVYLPDGPGGDRIEEKIFAGPLDRITRDAIAWIERSYLKQIITKRPDRPEAERVWNWPLAAIEEAIVNAVYHRSYEEREPVEVRLTPDELTVLSVPGPDRSVDLDLLRQGKAVSRRYRNRRIGELLKELDLTEGRSTGVSKILRVMTNNGSPPPSFETDEDRSTFLVRLPAHERAPAATLTPQDTGEDTAQVTPQDAPQDAPQDTPQDSGEHTAQVTGEVTPQVTPQVRALLEACDGALDRDTLQQRVSLSDRKHFREAYLRPALNAGVIEMTLPTKPTSRHQRYRLTELGRRVLAMLGTT